MISIYLRAAVLSTLTAMALPGAAIGGDKAEILDVRKLWDKAPHNAFTDMVRFRDRWYIAFREGRAHVSRDGSIRILTSSDGETWSDAGQLTIPGIDLRDPKFTITPRQSLILSTAGAFPEGSPVHHQSYLFFTTDGRDWSKPIEAGDPNIWMWRINWHRERAYSIGYSTWGPPLIRLYTSDNGIQWKSLVDELLTDNYPNESAMLFSPDDTGYVLLRRDKGPATALLGTSRPPYRGWTWKDTGVRVGAPQMLRLADDRIVVATRLYDGKQRTALCWLDLQTAKLTEFLALPSGGDCSYPGMVLSEGVLWVSYYSSHEGKTAIYLAKVKLPAPLTTAKPANWMPPKKY